MVNGSDIYSSQNDELMFMGGPESKGSIRSRSSSSGKTPFDRVREVKRKLSLGLPVDADEFLELVSMDSSLYLPDNYEQVGRQFVLSPSRRSGTMTKDGDTIFGRGPFGSMTGEEAMGMLSQRPSGFTPFQSSLIDDTRGRIASRKQELEAFEAPYRQRALGGDNRMFLSESGRRLEQMKREEAERKEKVAAGLGTKTGRTKFERALERQKNENPIAWMQYQRQLDAEKRLQDQAASDEDRRKRRREVREKISKAIASGEYSSEVVAALNGLKNRSFDENADPDDALTEAMAIVETQKKKQQEDYQAQLDKEGRAKEAQIEKETRAATEWDRRKGVSNSDRIAAENRATARRRVADEQKSASTIQREINEIGDDLASANAEIAELERLATELGEDEKNAGRIGEIGSAIQARRVQLSGLQAELQSKQSRAPQSPAGGMNQYSERNPARPQTQRDFDSLPAGAIYIDPDDGQLYRK
jgi:hypothetical protein